MNDPNDTNPYAPPVPVDEDTVESGYDLRKIAEYHNQLGIALRLSVVLLIILFVSIACFVFLSSSFAHALNMPPWLNFFVRFLACLFFPAFASLLPFAILGVLATERIARAMKYQGFKMVLILLGAISGGVNFYVMVLMRRKARAILRDAGMKTAGRKIDLAQFRREEDY